MLNIKYSSIEVSIYPVSRLGFLDWEVRL